MIKLMDLLEATSPVKIGSALPGSGGRRKEIEIVVDKSMGKWKIVYFNMVRKYVSGVGHSPDRMINYDDIFKLSSSEKRTIQKIIKNPEDIAYMDDGNVKPKEVLRALK
jgi:hypothetical protein